MSNAQSFRDHSMGPFEVQFSVMVRILTVGEFVQGGISFRMRAVVHNCFGFEDEKLYKPVGVLGHAPKSLFRTHWI